MLGRLIVIALLMTLLFPWRAVYHRETVVAYRRAFFLWALKVIAPQKYRVLKEEPKPKALTDKSKGNQ